MEKDDLEEKRNQTESKKIVSLLKELAQSQLNKSLVEAAEFKNNARNTVATKVQEMRNYIKNQAKRYGQNEAEVENIMSKFETFLKEAKSKYKDARAEHLEEKAEIESKEAQQVVEYDEAKAEFEDMPGYRAFAKRKAEIKAAKKSGNKKEYEEKKAEFESYKRELPDRVTRLKADINNDMDNGNVADAKAKMAKLEKLQRQAKLAEKDNELKDLRAKIRETRVELILKEEEIKECDKTFKETVEGINNNQEKSLAKVDKQNFFQKVLARAYNRFGGAKKFITSVKEPIEANLTKFKDKTIPEMIQKVGKTVDDTKKGIGEKVSSIVRGAKTAKDNIIENAINKIQQRIDRNNERIKEAQKSNTVHENSADIDVNRAEKIEMKDNKSMEMVD